MTYNALGKFGKMTLRMCNAHINEGSSGESLQGKFDESKHKKHKHKTITISATIYGPDCDTLQWGDYAHYNKSVPFFLLRIVKWKNCLPRERNESHI